MTYPDDDVRKVDGLVGEEALDLHHRPLVVRRRVERVSELLPRDLHALSNLVENEPANVLSMASVERRKDRTHVVAAATSAEENARL